MKKPNIEKIRSDYCTCGAAQGLIDGYYPCLKDCYSHKMIKKLTNPTKRKG